MPVAPSFQKFEILNEPFEINSKLYVNVLNKKTNSVKQVRYYSEKEYNKLYGQKTEQESAFSKEPAIKVNSMRKAFGFDKGYITIFKGDTYSHLEYFQLSTARYCKHWGWYFISTEPLPDDIPEDVTPIQLPWELVGEGEELKPEALVKIAVESLIYEESPSQFVGSIGERLEINVKVVKVIPIENNYGKSYIYLFMDENQNYYSWITSSTKFLTQTNNFFKIRGTIKEHYIYKNVKTTKLFNCRNTT